MCTHKHQREGERERERERDKALQWIMANRICRIRTFTFTYAKICFLNSKSLPYACKSKIIWKTQGVNYYHN